MAEAHGEAAQAEIVNRQLLRLARRRGGALFVEPDAEEIEAVLRLGWLARANFALRRMVMFDHAVVPRDARGDIYYHEHQVGPEAFVSAFPFYPAEAYARLDLTETVEETDLEIIDMDRFETHFLTRMAREGIHLRLCPAPGEDAALFPAADALATLRGLRHAE